MSNETKGKPAPDQEISMDALGPAGVKGHLRVLAIRHGETRSDGLRLSDVSKRQFKVTARLSKAPLPTGDIKGDFNADDGCSYLRIPDNINLTRVHSPEGVFDIKKNKQGEQSIIEFECESTTASQAKTLFLRVVLPFLDYETYLANCPLFITSIRIEDPKNLCTDLDYVSPYRNTFINPHIKSVDPDLVPIYALYRDAKNSHSDFYSFLCYHKILEGLLGPLRGKLRQRAKEKGVQLPQRHDTVPNDSEITPPFDAYIGKSIRAFFDDVMTPEFRNAASHFILADGSVLNLSSPSEIDRYASIRYITELCVRAVIQRHDADLLDLGSTL